MSERNDGPYKAWRRKVLARDRGTCQMEGCGSMTKVVAHHIKPWASHPELRYDPDNGIALCQACHDKIKDREGGYEEGFSKTVRQKKTAVADAMFVRYLKRDG